MGPVLTVRLPSIGPYCVFGRGVSGSNTYSSGVKVRRSFRSAPAQNALSLSLARMRARVGPLSPSAWMDSTAWLSSASNCLEMALRVLGRFKDRILMLPACGAGTEVILIAGAAVLYACLA